MNWWAVLEIVAGALISAGFLMWTENIRKANLTMKIEPSPIDVSYANRPAPAQRARYVRLIVQNAELPGYAGWLSRSPAVGCIATITFHHLDGQNVFGRSMSGRWAGTPEPVPIQAFSPSGLQMIIVDPVRLSPELRRDIRSGVPHETLDISARFDSDSDCYGWCNDNYFSTPRWRNPDWKLSPGRYLVRVNLRWSGGERSGLFRLINDVPVNAFRLEKAQASDYRVVS